MNKELMLNLISELINLDPTEKSLENIEKVANAKDVIGKYVIVRTRNEGLNCGYLKEADETGCVLLEARRIWRSISKDKSLSWYEGVAQSGLHEEGKISCKVAMKVIVEDYSITAVTEIAKISLEGFKSNETTY